MKEEGVTGILNSRGRNNALEGIDLIKALVEKAEDKIIIMTVSGGNKNNLYELMQKTKALELPDSTKIFENCNMLFNNKKISNLEIMYGGKLKNISVTVKSL